MAKTYTVVRTQSRTGVTSECFGTLTELVKGFSYTLDCGQCYAHESGNSKINTKPGTINSLISNLNKAVDNAAANGYAGVSFAVKG